ncbi:MarR family winged helix-turn-helix transcriptional regulator [Marinomonas ostreistagni]|uniref:MarR family winged helix-turn-helix transcriptional regulator n=1 Tax=Marinomonas ostreistagni TaxID=359209 RepID=UPI001951BE54|nr:MarR family transcriptional regulator [Marinomonas ostreistagni]MBM6550739.1 MarR family transcriptional regulator [Marinomonas ostreistagni]
MSSIATLNKVLTEYYDKMASWEACVVRESEYSLAQIHTLEVLGNYGATNMKTLAHRLGITTGTLTVQVEKLVKQGLVQRQYSEDDRRSITVALTDAGQAIHEHHNALHIALTEDLTKDFSDAERDTLIALLSKVNQEF